MQRASLWLLTVSAMLLSAAFDSNGGVAQETKREGVSSREARAQAVRTIPLSRFSPRTQKALSEVVNNPSFFRRMPTQEIQCDPQMLQFLVRRPEVLVNIWELMGITQVSAKRTAQNSFRADDGVGTQCQCDLVFSNDRMHIYYGNGDYSGSMTPRRVKGRCVCVLHTKDYTDRKGEPVVAGTMDVFLKLDNFGADILTRTLGPFVGKTADYNFAETAKFVGQISQLCTNSPAAAQGLAMRLTNVDDSVRREFAGIAAKIAANANAASRTGMSAAKASGQNPLESPMLRLSDSRGDADKVKVDSKAKEPQYGSYFDSYSKDAELPVATEAPVPNVSKVRLTDSGKEGMSDALRGVSSTATQPPRWVRPSKPHAFMRR
ncbi:MAG: hypothetical protein Aurels2KO_42790 [Aureliella sp.]